MNRLMIETLWKGNQDNWGMCCRLVGQVIEIDFLMNLRADDFDMEDTK